jgi:hypothetical protein
MLPNEARQQLGLPQVSYGDEPFQLKPQDAASQTTTRQRDSDRSNNQSDSPATISGRNPKGEGRSSQ